MRMRSLLGLVLLAVALVGSAEASLFVTLPFDQVVRQSEAVVRGTVLRTWSAWDESGETIYTFADIQVGNWLAGSGRQTITVREIGGTVADYTQEAIDFPVLRTGEDVILFLTRWDDNGDFRIQAYNQGKFLVRHDGSGRETLVRDVRTQGSDNPAPELLGAAEAAGMPMDEFEMMFGAARKAIAEQNAR